MDIGPTGLADAWDEREGVRERREMRIWGFLASTVGWTVLPVTEMGRLGRNRFSENWGRMKSQKCMKFLWKEEER